MGTNLLFVRAGSKNVGGVRSGTGATSTNTLNADDIEAIKRECSGSLDGEPGRERAGGQLVFGNQNWNTSRSRRKRGVSDRFESGLLDPASSLPKVTCALPRASVSSGRP